MNKKIGVYICHCGGNISDYVDVEKVKESIANDEGVFLAKTTMFACGDANQQEMVNDIKKEGLDGVVVASCSPKLHLLTFRAVTERAGLNKYNYVHANIREQASWAHSDDKTGATEKAILIVKSSIAKVRLAKSLESFKILSKKAVAVIGGGVAGIRAAIELSDMGCPVTLIEREPFVGGRVAQWDSLFPTNEPGKELVSKLNDELLKKDNITVITGAEVISNSGSIGDFKVKIKTTTPETEIKEIHVGSILVATGFDTYTPADGEFGYNQTDNVITLPQFKSLIELNNKTLIYKGKEVNKIAYIYCVGSRQTDGENKYCSRYCCTSAIHAALQTKQKYHDIQNYHFTRGIRTYGKQEVLYAESLKEGDIYLQSYEDDPALVTKKGDKTIVTINDILTGKRELSVETDLAVLVTGMVPRADNSIASILKIPKGRDGFFNEIHMKLRPVETVIDGVTICGASQGPKNIMESVNSALSAAAKSFSYVSKGELELEPIIAKIDKSLCSWCGSCAEACPFDAIRMVKDEKKDVAAINNSVCKGCGMCLPVCPSDAIDLVAYSNKEIESMIDELAV